MLLKHLIAKLAIQAVESAQENGSLPAGPLPEIEVERPQHSDHGDFAISLPLRLTRSVGINPMVIAQLLVPLIPKNDAVSEVRVASPGFINFVLNPSWLQKELNSIIQESDSFGNIKRDVNERIQLEFASVNPTGPLHVGHARTAVLGSVLSNLLAAAGFEVSTEYYINDAGTQMDNFYKSLYARYMQELGHQTDMPESGYIGSYITDLAKEVITKNQNRFVEMPEEKAVAQIGALGLKKMLSIIRKDLESVNVNFDVWFSETDELHKKGEPDATLNELKKAGYIVNREGATWFESTKLGEERDNVLIRSTGEPTYFALDIAYHSNKFLTRGFDRVINIWGADHQGHVSRMKAAVSAIGVDPERLQIIISQLVALKHGDEVVRASKRTGEMITMRDLVDEVGADACRFFFLSRTPESQMEFDMELAKKESADNPVYYVQYAHARIAGIMNLANQNSLDYTSGDVGLLTHSAEIALIKKMLALPELIDHIGDSMEAHLLPKYATELAAAFHWFYQQCRVVSEIPDEFALTMARLKLVECCRIVFARCLSLMGMSAPEKM
ncbi:MAG: arginyl-tRNA synthetase [Chloroflexi bacterium]|jgi:arginyl-tRNA synthetase|nr:MAG: arginyl-tRNA synthetase [Chloroflexota bacterium]